MQKRYYTKEFKLNAIDLANQRENVSQVASELGIRADMLRRWKKEYEKDKSEAFSGSGHMTKPKDKKLSEIQALKKRVKELELERDILKKAVGIFSESDRTNTSSL